MPASPATGVPTILPARTLSWWGMRGSQYSSLSIMDNVSAPLDLARCSVCHCQVVWRGGDHVPARPYPALNPPTSIAIYSNDQDDILCTAHSEPGPTLSRVQHLSHGPNVAKQVPPAEVVSTAPNAHTIYSDPDLPRPSTSRTVIDRRPDTLFCSDQCRFADRRSCQSAIDTEYDSVSSTSPRLPLVPANSLVSYGSQDDSDHASQGSSDSRSSDSSPSTDYALNAYSRLRAIYNFDPLPPLPPKVKTSPQEPAPAMDGGIIMAARRIQAALCIDKHTKTSWGLPIYTLDSEDDNKPIPGWTDGSNAWRASVYGLAPPRDFTRTDPDDAAIRAYGSYVATPHRSRGVQSSPSLPPNTVDLDPSTQELYRQYRACFTLRAQSRTPVHVRGARFSTSSSSNGSTLLSRPRDVPLLKPGAEGRLLVPDVKMRRGNSFSGASVSSGKTSTPLADAPQCTRRQRKGGSEPNANRTQSYKSESITYPIMRMTPKKEIRVERRVVDGVEQDVEVEVLIEQPIKRLFLFGGARD